MRIIKVISLSLVVIAGVAALALQYALPAVVEHEVRARLDAAGYPDARFTVGSVGLDRVELLDFSLLRGLDLGDVTVQRSKVVLHKPQIDADVALGRLQRSGKRSAFGKIEIVDGTVTKGTEHLAVKGTIDLRTGTPQLDLVAHSPAIRVGKLTLHDVAARLRGRQACATATVETAQVDACYGLDSKQLAWTARADRWTARGDGHVVGTSFTGHVDATLPERTLALHADVTGDPKTFTVHGELAADELAHDKVSFRGVRLPFELAGRIDGKRVRLTSARDLAVSATSATITFGGNEIRIDSPVVTGSGRTELGPLALAVGDHAESFKLVAQLNGVPIDRVLSATTRRRVRGTGVLDGQLELAVDDGALALVGGKLTARSPGQLQIAELATEVKADDMATAVHKRIAAALADFQYSKLALTVAGNPDLRLSLRGRGRRVPQELDIDVNVRGLLAHSERNR